MKKMTNKQKAMLILMIFIVFVVCVGLGLLLPNMNANKKPDTIPYEEINFTTNDVSSMEFALNGQVLTFPTSVKEIESVGYILDASYQNEVLAGSNGTIYYSLSCSARSDSGSTVKFSAYNLAEESKSITDCEIETIFAKDEQFILCNGITISSSYDEVIAVMGEPTEYEEDYNSKTLTYEIGDEYSIYIKYLYGNYEEMETLMLIDRTH